MISGNSISWNLEMLPNQVWSFSLCWKGAWVTDGQRGHQAKTRKRRKCRSIFICRFCTVVLSIFNLNFSGAQPCLVALLTMKRRKSLARRALDTYAKHAGFVHDAKDRQPHIKRQRLRPYFLDFQRRTLTSKTINGLKNLPLVYFLFHFC